MNLIDLTSRASIPTPWMEEERIPWNEPGFSARMLKEHLNQSHDLASRRVEKIADHIDWIHRELLACRPSKILDLGCGPGLYTSRLAHLGHTCTGIDFSPASIAYAAAYAADLPNDERKRCTYLLEDIRTANFGSGYDLVMFIFGEFNVFSPRDAFAVLNNCYASLSENGVLLIEPHTFAAIQRLGTAGPAWYSSKNGLFSDKPHLALTENFWDPEKMIATRRYYIVDAASSNVTRYSLSTQAYRREQYCDLLESCGFNELTFFPSLTGVDDPTQADLFAITARKKICLDSYSAG